MKIFIKTFFIRCKQVRRTLRICLHFLKKTLKGNFVFVQCLDYEMISEINGKAPANVWDISVFPKIIGNFLNHRDFFKIK